MYECCYVSSRWWWWHMKFMELPVCIILLHCRGMSFSKCKWISVTVWQISRQDAPTCSQHIPVRTMSLRLKAKWEAKTSTSLQTVILGRSIKGNTVYIWFWRRFCPRINIYLFMMRWKRHFKLGGSCGQGHSSSIWTVMFTNTNQITCVLSPERSVAIVHYILMKRFNAECPHNFNLPNLNSTQAQETYTSMFIEKTDKIEGLSDHHLKWLN